MKSTNNTKKRVSTKIAYNEYKFIDEDIKKGNYLNQSDFYREAIRDKIRSIKERRTEQ